MNTPLYNKLLNYRNEKIPFHMPGHKFGKAADLSKLNLSYLDNTEVKGLDNLYAAEAIIKEASRLMADFYGAKETIFLTNGSTAGILASILAVCNPGDKILVARNSHHSVWSALIHAGAIPIYINPKYEAEEDLLGEVALQDIQAAIERYPDIKAAIIVSPTYEGIVSDIESIANYLHKKDKILIVDEAHGAHFILGEKFPISSIRKGADLVINSLHKTLPTLTQSALLHICSDRVSYSKVITVLRMIQTSSPSYMLMGIIDYMRGYLIEHKEEIDKGYIEELISMRGDLKKLSHLKLIEFYLERYDRSKIIISTRGTNIDGYQLADWLDQKYNIVVEAALSTYVILMTTLADDKQTLGLLKESLFEIDGSLVKSPIITTNNDFLGMNIVEGMSPRDVFYADKEWCQLGSCEGKKIARHIMLYPPGVPIICLGETINFRNIMYIEKLQDKLQGIKKENKVLYLEVLKVKENI
ncbi:amino acid decarboxylase [Sporanaerobium hydrogeniformans]|uniref:Amino acid decarboxylase n=1 Tax=Sporanaerobium hydrogeniformans TaxID=3072179 RepID=A0AC61D9W4_9FIRM|nr:aminotransferase class V-fold PLP-dependent enzyme [Sporanaerobium hydrogeniformans]PHV69382.1 amino acid decarboxylase [Sporanaerobium hydrogeniformans]